MSEQEVVSEEEMNYCPECEESLTVGDTEFLGEGLMVVRVHCTSCGWYGSEEWLHDKTLTDV